MTHAQKGLSSLGCLSLMMRDDRMSAAAAAAAFSSYFIVVVVLVVVVIVVVLICRPSGDRDGKGGAREMYRAMDGRTSKDNRRAPRRGGA